MSAPTLKFVGRTLHEKYLLQIVNCLKADGVVIIPTDTVYSFAGSIHSHKAFERICRIKNIKPEKANFSLLCHDLSNISYFTKPFSKEVFRFMKNSLPGPYTFILNANNNVPSIFKTNKKTIGIRVPDNAIAMAIIDLLEAPLMVTSVYADDKNNEYLTDPDAMQEKYGEQIDLIVDGGPASYEPSTVIDCTGNEPVLVREGKGEI